MSLSKHMRLNLLCLFFPKLALTLGTEYGFRDWIYVSSLNAEDVNGCQHLTGTNRPVLVWGRCPRNDLYSHTYTRKVASKIYWYSIHLDRKRIRGRQRKKWADNITRLDRKDLYRTQLEKMEKVGTPLSPKEEETRQTEEKVGRQHHRLERKDLCRDPSPCTQPQGMETVGSPFISKGRGDKAARGKKWADNITDWRPKPLHTTTKDGNS